MMNKATIAAIYDVAKRIREGSLSTAAGIKELHERFGMNLNSAKASFVNIGHMLKGETYKRTMNAIETEVFLDLIHDDYGADALRKAIASVEQHIRYNERLPKGNNLLNIREIVHKYRAGEESEPGALADGDLGHDSPNAFLLEWNPRGYPWANIEKELEDAERNGEDAIS